MGGRDAPSGGVPNGTSAIQGFDHGFPFIWCQPRAAFSAERRKRLVTWAASHETNDLASLFIPVGLCWVGSEENQEENRLPYFHTCPNVGMSPDCEPEHSEI